MNPAVAAWVERTRAAQGLPLRVTDEAALDLVAAIITAGARVEEVVPDAKAS